MPNWCTNMFSVTHPEKEMMERFVNACKEGRLFQEFIPMPEELNGTTSPSDTINEELISKYGADDWYTWCLNNWGSKWDINVGDVEYDEQYNQATGWFDTPWGPAIEAYRKLTEQGFDVNVMYHEPGMCFAGRYTSGGDDEYVDYDFSDPNWRDNMDEDLAEYLEPDYESYLEMLEEQNEGD